MRVILWGSYIIYEIFVCNSLNCNNVQNWPFMFSFKWSEDGFAVEGYGLLIVLIYWAIGIVDLRWKTAELDLMDCGRRRK